MIHVPNRVSFAMSWSEVRELSLDDFDTLLEMKHDLAGGE